MTRTVSRPGRDGRDLPLWPSSVTRLPGGEPQLHPGHVASWSQNAPRPRREQSRGFLAAFPVAQGSPPLRLPRKRPAAVPPDVRVPASGVSPCGPSRARRPFAVAVPLPAERALPPRRPGTKAARLWAARSCLTRDGSGAPPVPEDPPVRSHVPRGVCALNREDRLRVARGAGHAPAAGSVTRTAPFGQRRRPSKRPGLHPIFLNPASSPIRRPCSSNSSAYTRGNGSGLRR